MSTTPTAPDPVRQVDAYIVSLLAILGSQDPIEVLEATPDALTRLIAGTPPDILTTPEAPGKWSMLQVVQHLADSEIVGAFRFRMTLAHDRPSIPGYDQDLWASRLRYHEGDVDSALDQFTSLRKANVRVLLRTTPAERLRVAIHAERGEESLTMMMKMYAGHDLIHLRQLARIKAGIGAGSRVTS